MTADKRRLDIINKLNEENKPVKGNLLANIFNVTRQVIVKDIAILRAQGHKILATPEGYILNCTGNKVKRIIAVNHSKDYIEKELKIIISYGGMIEDVIIEHSLYGEIRANLMVKNLKEMESFVSKFKANKTSALLELTDGIHLHTICAESEEDIENIVMALEKENLLLI